MDTTNYILDYLQTKVTTATDVEASALIGMEVVHTAVNSCFSLGHGVITDAANGMLTVQFTTKTTKFPFPMALNNTLSPVDPAIQKRFSQLGICPPAPTDSNCLNFRLTSDNQAYIVDSCAKEVENIVIPAEHQGIPVKMVAGDVFKNSKLKTITIPSTITKIAFYLSLESSLESICVEKNNKEYMAKDGVLYSKDSKELIFYPNGKTETSVVIHNTVEKIGYQAFRRNRNIKELFIGKNVKTIDERAFTGCSALERIQVDPSNPNYQSKDGVLYSKDGKMLLCVPRQKSTRYLFMVDKTVEVIEPNAFYGVERIQAIYVGKNVKYIDKGAFCQCKAERIYISEATSPIRTAEYDDMSLTLIHYDVEIFNDDYFDDGPHYTDALIGGIAGSKIENYCNKRDIKFIAVEDHKEAVKNFFLSPLDELAEREATAK